MEMGSFGEELAEELKNAGNRLLNPPDVKDELLNLLDHTEIFLSKVEQAPSDLIKESLVPMMKALSAKELLKHADMGVKVSTLSCITEITRISAPEAPFDDEKMKEIFELTAAAFEKLSHVAGRCYSKAVSVLTNVARIRLTVVMLDLECEELIIKMFQTFLKVIRSNHPLEVFSFMEAIMTVTLEESEEISLELLNPLLASVRKENQKISAASWKLGNRVIENCADMLKPCLIKAMQSTNITVNDYSPIVISICENASDSLKHNVNGSGEHLEDKNKLAEMMDIDDQSQVVKGLVQDDVCQNEVGPTIQTGNDDSSPRTSEPCQARKSRSTGISFRNTDKAELKRKEKSESQPETIPQKRGRKPNSLMKPDEGYYNSWFGSERRVRRLFQQKRRRSREVNSSWSKNSASKVEPLPLECEKSTEFQNVSAEAAQGEVANSPPNRSSSEMGQRKKKKHTVNQEIEAESLSAPKVISGIPLVEKYVSPAVASLKQDRDDRNVTKGNQGRRWKKSAVAVNTEVKATPPKVDVVKEKESGVSSGSDSKSLIRSVAKDDTRNINKKGSLVQMDGKKRRRRVKSAFKKDIAEGSRDKLMDSRSATLSSKKHENNLDGSLHKKVKRKRTTGREEASRMANDIHDLGKNLVGRMVKVWWPMDKRFYEGIVNSFDPLKKNHQILYLDGDQEQLDLNEELWELIPDDNLPDEENKTDFPSPNASSSVRRKKKGNIKPEHSGKQPKAKSASKRDATSEKGENLAKICQQVRDEES